MYALPAGSLYLAGAARVRESQVSRAAMGRVSSEQTAHPRALFHFRVLTSANLFRQHI
jgi:hypothetical protein